MLSDFLPDVSGDSFSKEQVSVLSVSRVLALYRNLTWGTWTKIFCYKYLKVLIEEAKPASNKFLWLPLAMLLLWKPFKIIKLATTGLMA